MAVAIVAGPLVGVAEHVVRLRRFLEFLFGRVVADIAVGMELRRQLSVRLSARSAVGAALDLQDLVVVAFRAGHRRAFSHQLSAINQFRSVCHPEQSEGSALRESRSFASLRMTRMPVYGN